MSRFLVTMRCFSIQVPFVRIHQFWVGQLKNTLYHFSRKLYVSDNRHLQQVWQQVGILLSALGEVNETRLGLSRGHPRGSGVGPHYADDIWRQLSMPVVQYAALHRLEDIRLFFDGIGPDRISDITTRIIYPELVQFNHSMLNKYPALKTKTRNQDREVYNSGTRQLITKPFLLIDPTTSTMREDCLLLVPKKWVFWRSLMDLTPFYNRFATETIQDERTTYTSDSRKLAPTKQKIKDEFPDKRELNNIQAVKYKRQGRDLVEEYRSEVLKDFTPMTDDEFKKYLGL
ncbi:hypothetical protein [Bifidobacterium asteroides]|uniref:hypothetical protein n=1 Tax=Bifidobacterium asteroides TaxID=1684 RepID=UPI003A800EB0